MFVRYVVAVWEIGYSKLITRSHDNSFPLVVHGKVKAVGLRRFYNEDPWTEATEVHAPKCGEFMAFNIDLEEVNVARRVLFADLRQRHSWNGVRLALKPGSIVGLGDSGFQSP